MGRETERDIGPAENGGVSTCIQHTEILDLVIMKNYDKILLVEVLCVTTPCFPDTFLIALLDAHLIQTAYTSAANIIAQTSQRKEQTIMFLCILLTIIKKFFK